MFNLYQPLTTQLPALAPLAFKKTRLLFQVHIAFPMFTYCWHVSPLNHQCHQSCHMDWPNFTARPFCRQCPEKQWPPWSWVCISEAWLQYPCHTVLENRPYTFSVVHHFANCLLIPPAAWSMHLAPCTHHPRVWPLYPLCQRREEKSVMASSQRRFSSSFTPKPELLVSSCKQDQLELQNFNWILTMFVCLFVCLSLPRTIHVGHWPPCLPAFQGNLRHQPRDDFRPLHGSCHYLRHQEIRRTSCSFCWQTQWGRPKVSNVINALENISCVYKNVKLNNLIHFKLKPKLVQSSEKKENFILICIFNLLLGKSGQGSGGEGPRHGWPDSGHRQREEGAVESWRKINALRR